MRSSYRKILGQRNFFLLWTGQILSQFGDRLTQMALIGLVYQLRPSSPLGLAKIMSIPIVAVFLFSPVAGVYVDRWNRQKTLWVSDLLRGIFICLLPFTALYFRSLLPAYGLIFLSFCVGRFFIPAKMAIVPELVEGDQILPANSLVSTTAMIAAILGFGLGGVIVERWGVTVAFVIDAGTFLLSALLIGIMRIPQRAHFQASDIISLGKDALRTVKNSVVFEFKEGVKYIFGNKETRYAAKVFSLLFSCVGSLYVVFIVFIQDTFNSVTLDLGWLAVGSGIGLFCGSLAYGKLGKSWPIRKVIDISLVMVSAWLVFFVSVLHHYPHKPFAFFSCFFLGLLASPVVIGVNTLIHNQSQNGFWGRIFSSLEVLIHLAFIVWMFSASFLAEQFSTFTIIIAVGIIIFIFSGFNFINGDK